MGVKALSHLDTGVNVISRHWRGLAKSTYSDEYVEHLRSETFPQLSKIAGFVNALILKRSGG
ncbi:MAG: hypothetical protein ACREVI_11275 [Steroidobacteraceae bacterium]